MSYATARDIEDRWRTLTPEEQSQASILLSRVSALMRGASPGLDARVAADEDLAVVARGIAVDAVLRVMRNPEGWESETVGPFSWRRSRAVSDGALYLTSGEVTQLGVGGPGAGAFTITPGARTPVAYPTTPVVLWP